MKFLQELNEAKSAGKNGIDLGGMAITKLGYDANGNWSYWIKIDGKNKKIQTTNLDGGSGKITDINDFKKLTKDAKRAIKLIKDYLNEDVNELTEGAVKFNKIEAALSKQGFTLDQMNGYDKLKLMDDAGFKVMYDIDKQSGTANYKGFKLDIAMGNEGMHISNIANISIKGGEKEFIVALKKLLSIALNYG